MTAQNYNAKNERIKRQYFTYLKEAKGYSEASVDEVAKALHRLDSYTKFAEFRKFHIEQAIAFKKHLFKAKNVRTGKPLSKATLGATLSALRGFVHWLAGQPGYRSRISYGDAAYFSLSESDDRIAKITADKPFPSVEQVRHAISKMPSGCVIERRNRALIALTLLTGARINALISLKLKHLDMAEGKIRQDAREVKTKFAKTFTTWFCPVGDDSVAIIADWTRELTVDHLFGPDDPIFPKTLVHVGEDLRFTAHGLSRSHWQTAGAARTIFREAFEAAGLPYYHPHSFRRTLVQLGSQLCQSPEEFKAWSQNLGHEGVMTTFVNYGSVAQTRQADIIRRLGRPTLSEKSLISQIKALVHGR